MIYQPHHPFSKGLSPLVPRLRPGARWVIDAFMDAGHSMRHSLTGSTLHHILNYCYEHQIGFTLQFLPGVGYTVEAHEKDKKKLYDLPRLTAIARQRKLIRDSEINTLKEQTACGGQAGQEPQEEFVPLGIKVAVEGGWCDLARELVIATCLKYDAVFLDRACVGDSHMQEAGIKHLATGNKLLTWTPRAYVFFAHRGMVDLDHTLVVSIEPPAESMQGSEALKQVYPAWTVGADDAKAQAT